MQFMLITGIAILCCSFFTLWLSYDMLEEQVIEEIRSYAFAVEDLYSKGNDAWKELDVSQDSLRITLVNQEGKVLFDNYVELEKLDNHADRIEIREAMQNGYGVCARDSDTLSESWFYYAVRAEDGCIVRVAKQTSNVWGILKRMIPMITGIMLVLFSLCAFFSQMVTKRLVAPIEDLAMHMNHLDKIEVYEELVPFVNTIQEQHENILKNATMRQDFTANVSHELKTPLTSISGYAELMENNLVDGENVAHFARAIHQNADRLLTLINDIIRLSELDTVQGEPEFEQLDLLQITLTCVQMLQMNAKNHQVSLTAQGEQAILYGNKQMLEELVYNLCDNAIRYNRENGFVRVEVTGNGKEVVLVVEDNGIGISKEHQSRIFERFYRVDKSRSKATGGTGLGLAIVKHIAAVHDAVLEVVSEPDKGTKIQVIFQNKNEIILHKKQDAF